MNLVRAVVGIVLCLLGALWIGQGLGYVPGSFMTGRPAYALLGAVAVLIGLALLAWAARRRRGG
jgi:hypothetical protein